MNAWLGALEAYGYEAPGVSYAEWCDRLRAYVADEQNATKDRELALLPLFHLVAGNLPADSIAPELDDSNAAAVLRKDSAGREDTLADYGVTTETAGVYLAYLVAIASCLPLQGGTELPRFASM